MFSQIVTMSTKMFTEQQDLTREFLVSSSQCDLVSYVSFKVNMYLYHMRNQ